MKLNYCWLREWVTPRMEARALADRLTLAGLEVGAIEPAGPALDQVVVGKVRAVSPHPNAEKLTVCDVETGRGQLARVVCGAPNVRKGMKAPLALPGAVLPGERRIAAAAIQGVESAGMLCSAAELGLGDDAGGLLVLDESARVGAPLADALQLDDLVLEIDLTPNRGDCLSVAGIAREVAALTGARLNPPPKRRIPVRARQRVPVKLIAKKECPRYAGRVVRNLDPGATTPSWMRERLRRAGVRSLYPIVDVTNYVMLELGQPMHAFDLNKLRGAIRIRTAGESEALTLLDGRNLTAPAGSLVIADDRGPIALAGIMGGESTAVDANTNAVFFESAFFEPEIVARYGRALGIQTESSQRFERGVDPDLQVRALERATELLLAIAGGEAGPISEARGRREVVKPIVLREARLAAVTGAAVPRKDVEAVLTRLGMHSRRTAGGWRVTPPSYRFDVRIEEDLIEEVARVTGYASIAAQLPAMPIKAPEVPEARISAERVRAFLVDRDYQEVITYSFVDPDLQRLIDPAHTGLVLANPISADMAVMRTTLWTGLLQTLRYNRNRQQARIRIIELGRRFHAGVDEPIEEPVLAGIASGPIVDKQWGMPDREVDFYDVKGDIEGLFALTGQGERFRFAPAAHPALHPGQSAAIYCGEEHVGWLGTLHPALQARLEVGSAILFEITLAALAQRRVPAFTEISRFPAIRRDLAVVVPEETAAAQVVGFIRSVAGDLLVNLQLFDVYRGESIDSGRKSLALGLTLQHSSRTLREAEVDALMAQIIASLKDEMGAELRS
ncbi:MAG: phenylalanine--tRNA ligase subunit beta [Sulfurifustis sp.]